MSDLPNFLNIGNARTGNFYIPASFSGKYRKPNDLGSGGYGTVVSLEGINREDIAVKRFITPFDDAKRAQRCFRELQFLRELDHENIVKMKFAFTTDATMQTLSQVYLVTVYCGADLNALLQQETEKNHRFNLGSFQRMISELLRALKFLNSANVIHRDLKPDNLAISDDGKLTLLDFGIARVLDENNQMTNEPGMRFYRAFETTSFSQNAVQIYNEKADMWSIGAILCEMLTGAILFEGKHPVLRAVEILGPIPDIVLGEIDHEQSRIMLRERSQRNQRMNFLQHLMQHGRSWLREEIHSNGEALANFIDRTLDYDHRARMSVDDALEHPFLAQVRIRSKEVPAGHSILDVGDLPLDKWRELIWRVIQASPVRFDEPMLH